MLENLRSPLTRIAARLRFLHGWLAVTILRCRHVLHRLRHPIPVEVLIVDRVKRRGLEAELRRGLCRLGRAVGTPLPAHAVVAVHQILKTDRHLAGCYQVWQRPDGVRCALFRLALQVNGRPLGPDELLATLAEQWIGLALEQSGAPSVLVPLELAPAEVPEISRLSALRPDPFAPHPNGKPISDQAA